MTEPSHAVFLSYATQDAGAAQRICEALRAAGVEVWFDKSDLRGGDAWDLQIRKQIHDCALFVPIISQHTHERLEGYFRREWKLAVDRTHDMAEIKAFLVPVVIDSTTEQDPAIPEKFRELQWTRLPAGETPPAFVEHVQRLLLGDVSPPTRPHAAPGAVPAIGGRAPASGWSKRLLPVAVAVVILAVVAYLAIERPWISRQPPVSSTLAPAAFAPPPHSVAVLPFVDMSEKKDQEYFSDGLSEELIDLLSKVPDLRVPARTSSFFFKDKPEDIATIARKLHVANVLEGSVRKASNTIRVTAQLIRADNGYHLWSETYDRDLKDVFKVQDEIASEVVSALKLKLAPGQQANSHRTSNPEAYNQYLLGRQFFERRSLKDFRRSVDAYRKAVELDPSYAAAYAELALSEYSVADYIGDPVGRQQALAAAEKAVALAPDEADGYVARGVLRCVVSWDWTGAQADYAKALALNPEDNKVQRRYGILLAKLGRQPESISALRKATELDPLSNFTWMTLGGVLAANRQFAQAHEAFRRALEIQPDFGPALENLGWLQLFEGKPAEALLSFRQEDSTAGGSTAESLLILGSLAGIAAAQHTLGHAKESQHALDELIAKRAQGFAYGIAGVYAWRDEKDKAFEWLELAYRGREEDLTYIKQDHSLDSLHGDPRFGAMLRKVNLPE